MQEIDQKIISLAQEMLNLPEGVPESVYRKLVDVVEHIGYKDILRSVEATDGMFYYRNTPEECAECGDTHICRKVVNVNNRVDLLADVCESCGYTVVL